MTPLDARRDEARDEAANKICNKPEFNSDSDLVNFIHLQNRLWGFNQGYDFAMAKAEERLNLANKLIAKFDPEDIFVYEDGSEDLAQEVADYLATHRERSENG